MENGIAHLVDDLDGIHSLPYKVARVEVCAELGADSLTDLLKRMCVVYAEAGMKLESNLVYAVSLCEFDRLLPIRNKNLVPLPIEYFKKILGPRTGDPVGVL